MVQKEARSLPGGAQCIQKDVLGAAEHIIPDRGKGLETNTRRHANPKSGAWPACVSEQHGFLNRGTCQPRNKPPGSMAVAGQGCCLFALQPKRCLRPIHHSPGPVCIAAPGLTQARRPLLVSAADPKASLQTLSLLGEARLCPLALPTLSIPFAMSSSAQAVEGGWCRDRIRRSKIKILTKTQGFAAASSNPHFTGGKTEGPQNQPF